MYSAQPNGADSATINPAALNSELANSTTRGVKRGRSQDTGQGGVQSESAGDDGDNPRKRGRPMNSMGHPGSMSEHPGSLPHGSSGAPATGHAGSVQSGHGATGHPVGTPQGQPGSVGPPLHSGSLPPHTPQSQNAPLPAQPPAYVPASASPPKTTPTKSTLKALPTVRDHTTDQLGLGGDEYLPRETDEAGEKKVLPNGGLLGGRTYRCRTFLVPNRGDKLFMLATECARILSYRDSYLLFNKNRSLYKIIANQQEKDDLVQQEILPFSYRSRQIAIVTARSMFRQFGSRMIEGGRRVKDDYWESKARKQGFTEADPAGEKRPGASRARAEAAEANQNAAMLGGPHGEIIYNNATSQFGAPPGLMPGPDYNENRTNRSEYAAILKTGPRQEITGPAYQDRTQPSPISDIHAQAHHAAEYNRSVNQQREIRGEYMQTHWRRPHEQPSPSPLTQPVVTDASVPTSRPAPSTHTAGAGLQQPGGVIPNQGTQMLMSTAPYAQGIHAQNPVGQTPIPRGSSGSLPQTSQNYNYSQSQMWPPTPQTPQHGYSAYTAQTQPAAHQQQSPNQQQVRHSSTGGQVPSNMPYSGMPGMGQGYGAPAQNMYPADQTPRPYMHQGAATTPAVTSAWPQQSAPSQWWPNQQQ